jgi:hypothetical protein
MRAQRGPLGVRPLVEASSSPLLQHLARLRSKLARLVVAHLDTDAPKMSADAALTPH